MSVSNRNTKAQMSKRICIYVVALLYHFNWKKEASERYSKVKHNYQSGRQSPTNKVIQLKFCEVWRNYFSNRCWKFQLSILKNKNVLFIKEYGLGRSSSKSAKRVLTNGNCCPNFQLRFCSKLSNYVQLPNCLIKKILARLYYKDYCGITAAILKNAEKSTFIVRKSTQ